MGRETIRTPKPFEILRESRSASWAEDIAILLSRVPAKSGSVWPFRTFLAKDGALKPVRGVLVSALLHASAFIFITQLNFTSAYEPTHKLAAADPAPVFIDMQALKALKILRSLPVIKPKGPGGRPGTSDQPVRIVVQASTVQHPKYTVVLNPLKPDNNRQAINQKLSPPDLKIQVEQKLPDIVLAEGTTVAKPQVDMSLHQPVAQQSAQDHLADPAPTVASNAPQLSFKINPTVPQPQLPTSYFTSNSLQAPHSGKPPASQTGKTSANSPGDPNGGIVVVSVDPGTFSQLASLAQGNRYGALAIAPSKEGPGSPGSSPNGTGIGGSGGPGKSGDGSSGVGPSHSGGAGGAAGSEKSTLSAVGGAGTSGGVDAHKLLGSALPATVYAVTSNAKLRRAPMVVSTGPMGGGGLDVYGALPCGKVYTIFLPMPGKSWVLEYCAHGTAAAKPQQANAGTIQMEAGLIPPSADQQFDFHRLALPEKDSDKLIVLRGLIDKDGSISDVHVFQGVQPEMDAEAALAFSNWKFKPATRASLPVSVDVLVGIPARGPEKVADTSGGAAQGNQN